MKPTTPEPHAAWQTIAVTEKNAIIELRFHAANGPLIWNATAHREIYEAFNWLAGSRTVKVVIITGTGPAYCSELDVTSFVGVTWDEIWWEGRRMLTTLNDIGVPIIAAVNGPATIHAEIPAMADILIAAPHATFADHAHFASRDTVPGDGVNLVWSELLGAARAKYFLLTGATLTAEDGLRIGFVSEIVASGQLSARAWKLAEDLARRSLPVLRYTKAAVCIGTRKNFAENLSHGLGVEGCAHWSKGGIKAGHVSS